MKTLRRLKMVSGAILITALTLIGTTVYAETPKKVLLMPFTLFAGEDLSYLQKGIGQMLTSRLTQPDKVEVIQADPAIIKDPNPAEKARSLGADYLVTGSVTLLGSSVSTDAQVMDLQQNRKVVNFNRVGKDQAAIIDHVDQLAARINADLFGEKTKPPTPTPTGTAPVVPETKAPEPSIYQHPEKLLTQSDADGRSTGLAQAGQSREASLMLRGRRVEYRIQGVTTGDVDGDGHNDIVCIGPSSVVVYRIAQKQLVRLAEVKAKGGHYIAVDAVDVNNNGKTEIFVTNFYNANSRVTSFVLEWDGQKLVRVADNLNWYFRAVDIPNRGRLLAGQRQGLDDPFGSTIHEVGWEDGRYGLKDRLPLPRGLNIYGFAFGNIRSDHDTEVVAYNTGGFVQILNRRGKEEWVTSERYGGSHVFIQFPDESDNSERLYVYLSPRIHLFDMDRDGLQEIFVIKNENTTGVFDRIRLFKNGRLEGLKWDDLGPVSQWRTRELAKYMSDFDFADLDGDGKPEVVASVVQQSGGVLSKARSYLAVFKLDIPQQKKGG